MATTNRDRIDVYTVSYVVRTLADGKHKRELRESAFGGTTPAEATANAERWIRDVYGDDLESVEIAAVRHRFTMERCAGCKKFRGPEGTAILCHCEGLLCRRCGRRNIWRPISDFYDEATAGFVHVPHFAVRAWCDECADARAAAKSRFATGRPWSEEYVLLEAGTPIRDADELRQRGGEALTEALLYLAVWTPGAYPEDADTCDSTFAILSFAPRWDVSAYVQFLSDPLHRTVLCEVSSLDYQPGLASRLTPDRQAALLARGFTTGPSPSNYRREVVIDGDDSAVEVAREALETLFDMLGYRGEEALMLQIVAERVSEGRPVGFEPGQLAALLRMDGYGVRVEARSAADDAGRLEVRVFDDIVVTVSASPNGRALRVTTPTGNPPRGDRQARMDRYRLARTVDGKEVLSIDVVLAPETGAEDVVDAVRMLSHSAFELRAGAVEEVDVGEEVVDPQLAGKWLPRKPRGEASGGE